MRAPQTWHHGLIADWWANFNLDAPEVDLYLPYLRGPVAAPERELDPIGRRLPRTPWPAFGNVP